LYKAFLDYSKATKINDFKELIFNYEIVLNTNLEKNEEIEDVFLITYKQ
jgi:hypothetical protein